MTDSVMCDDVKCLARKSCQRFTNTPAPRGQSYFSNVIKKNGNGCCDYFVRNRVNKFNTIIIR